MSIRVLIFEDNHSLREGLAEFLSTSDDIVVCGAMPDAVQAIDVVAATNPDVILMDIDMPRVSGIDALRQILHVRPATKILMLTVFDDNVKVFESLRAGASGYILKKTEPSRIIEAVKDIAAGGSVMSPAIARQVLQVFSTPAPAGKNYDLSDREKEVLAKLVSGCSYKMIAEALHISIDTVRTHIKNIYEKLHVNSKSEAVASAIRNKIV